MLVKIVLLIVVGVAATAALLWSLQIDERNRRALAERDAALRAQEKAYREYLWNDYQWVLAGIAIDQGAKLRAVAAGRAWYGYLRGGPCTVFDELAIMNDIKAAGG